MVTAQRWQAAQQYEQGYWQGLASRIAEGSTSQLEWYKWRADQLVARLRRLGRESLLTGSARVVEIGSGPVGLAAYYPSSSRITVDPLEEFYRRDPVLSKMRDPAVSYRQGLGEALPCESASADLVIIENCIDHVQNMTGVMEEIVRVLAPGGTLYLTVNCRSRPGYFMHRLLSRLRIDAGHPHTFTPRRLEKMLATFGFRVVDQEVGSWVDAVKEDLTSSESRPRLKAVLGVSEYLASVVCVRDTRA